MATVYLGLGSNISGPVQQIKRALKSLSLVPDVCIHAQSSLYLNPPMGPAQQPDYVNAVVCIKTGHSPIQLLDKIQALEAQQGRKRGLRWGPRSLDLDILLYDELLIESERLKIPHPGLCERNFVLYPLLEIAPKLTIPGRGHISDLVKNCEFGDLRKLWFDLVDY